MTAPVRGRRRPLTTVLALTAVAAATLAMTGPALADDPAAPAVGSACPAAFPAAELVRPTSTTPGTTVEGLTVSTGTTPDTVTGEYVGTLEDGIAPGIDMLIFKMQGSRITNSSGAVDRGIWSGMSGTPLYAPDGRLVGAVSYGQSYAPSEYAGVTPAADLYRAGAYGAAAAAPITAKVASAMRTTGASAAATSGSMRRLPTPVALPAGLSTAKAKTIAKKARLKGVTFRSGSASGRTSTQKIPVAPGSNVAASYSYGSFTLAGVGTTTAVCDSTVYAFGHPMDWMGRTKLSLHGADAVYVERDLDGSFKLANVGAPIGTVTQDRLAAIVGTVGAVPTGAKITTTNRFGARTRTSSSTVVSPDWISTLAAMQSSYDSWVVTDSTFGGEARATRTIRLRRANGQMLTYRRSDIYADRWDITAGAAEQLAGDIESLLSNDFEPVTIVDATQTSTVNEGYEAYSVGRVQAKQFGQWTTVDDNGVMARRGGYLRLRVTLVRDKGSAGPARKVVSLKVKVPRKKLKSPIGILSITGGAGSGEEDWEYYEDYSEDAYAAAGDATGLPALIRAMSTAERGNDVTAVLSMGSGRRAVDKKARKATATVVTGSVMLPVIRYGKAPKKR